MTTRTFAAWVQPLAAQLHESRTEVLRTARRFLPEFWGAMSPLPDWSYKDLLAHLATGDWVCQHILRTVLANEPLDVANITNPDWVAEGNARFLAERKERTADELIAEVETEGEETQELLSQLTDEHEHRTQEGAPMTLGQYLRDAFPAHDRDHLQQLETGLDNIML